MNLADGKVLWWTQFTRDDAYNVGCETPAKTHCPEPAGADFDFGQPPMLARLGGDGGRRALVIGQKSGMVHALDPDRGGKILWQTRAGKGGKLGGEPVGFGV